VALESPGCTLITADLRYLRKAGAQGRIASLERWRNAAWRARAIRGASMTDIFICYSSKKRDDLEPFVTVRARAGRRPARI